MFPVKRSWNSSTRLPLLVESVPQYMLSIPCTAITEAGKMDGNHARVVLYRGMEKDEICRMDIVYSSISFVPKMYQDI